jgi:hypothetical protein
MLLFQMSKSRCQKATSREEEDSSNIQTVKSPISQKYYDGSMVTP